MIPDAPRPRPLVTPDAARRREWLDTCRAVRDLHDPRTDALMVAWAQAIDRGADRREVRRLARAARKSRNRLTAGRVEPVPVAPAPGAEGAAAETARLVACQAPPPPAAGTATSAGATVPAEGAQGDADARSVARTGQGMAGTEIGAPGATTAPGALGLGGTR